MGKYLVFAGLVLVLAGVLWMFAERFGLGRLPGDIVIERDNFSLYLPITTGILISLLLSLIFWIIGRW